MNTATDNLQPGQQSAPSGNKPLWAAVGILGVAVLGMGGTMLYNQQKAQTPAASTSTVAVAAPQATKPAAAPSAADDLVEKPVAAPAKPAPEATKKVVKPVPKPAPTPAPANAGAAPAPSPRPAVQVCQVCGSVESVTPIERSAPASGVGAVAGGVLGAVVGNQIGSGSGRTAATILGAVGGGFAGNAVEKHVKKETVYQVGVRMDDGSRRVIEVSQAPSVGSQVTLEGAGFRTSSGVSYGPKPVAAPAPTQTAAPDAHRKN